MAGYWNRPDETAKVMTADGYFRTGDIGVMTADGYTKIVDRKKDMILVSRASTSIPRDRGSDRQPSRRARMRRDRRQRSAVGRGRQGLHRQEGPESYQPRT